MSTLRPFGLTLAAIAIGGASALIAPTGCHGGGSSAAGDAGGDALVVYENVGEVPAGKRRDVASSAVVWDEARHRVLVATGDGGALVRVDPDHPSTSREVIKLGGDLRSVSVSPDGAKVIVVDRGGQGVDAASGRVLLLDAATLGTIWVAELDGHPRAVVFDPARPRYAYVAVEDSGIVLVVDRATHSFTTRIDVGRLPSGVAASGARDELLVTHRIDGAVDVVDRTAFRKVASIALADSPANVDAKVPQGKPFAFESLAWSPDGESAWFPHQTYDGTAALQFQSVVFPAISVIDVVARAERTNDKAGSKRFPGRKELFGAINVKTAAGDAQVVSGPCAVAIHPNGQRAYALACASNDLLVFDAQGGAAAEILKLPGDHPSSLALDPTGGRAFVFADRSQTLSVIDLAGGSPIAHPTILDPGLIPLLDEDPLDPAMRRALTLFHRADHTRTFDDGGTPRALSGQSWMACASCHLDGLTSTNLFLFEASPRAGAAAAKDALIGHRNLRDFFASSASPDAPTFDPHDVVVAMLEMGGLALDTTGKDRTGEVDPNKPSPQTIAIARDLARVVARDMPQAPSWLLQGKRAAELPAATSTEASAAYCGTCHAEQYETWKRSAHAHAGEDPFVIYSAGLEAKRAGDASVRHCKGCHDPNGLRLGTPSLEKGQGVTCTSCHDVRAAIRAGGNGDLVSTPRDWAKEHKNEASAQLPFLRSATFCAGCHQSFVPGTGLLSIDTLNEWKASPYGPHDGRPGTQCTSCHMSKLESGAHDHSIVGGNVALAARYPTPGWREKIEANLATAAALDGTRAGDKIEIDVKAITIGHSLPTGVPDLRELWIELEGHDASGKTVTTLGAPATDGSIDESTSRLGLDLSSSDGTVLQLHELGLATAIPFDRRVPAGGAVHFSIDAKSLLATPNVVTVDAVLHYRNVRPPFYRAALGDPKALPPDVAIARTTVK